MRLLVTGGLGFIGSSFVRTVLAARPGWRVVNLDLVTYAGNPANLADVARDARYRFVRGDVAEPADVAAAFDGCDAIVHFAAESHVDRSIMSAGPFARTNVLGTQVLLDAVRQRGRGRLVVVSTDEVYGPLAPQAPPVTEQAALRPTSPYAASKAAADLLALAAFRTHGLDVVVTRGTNTFGPRQFPEKLVPLMVTNALEGRPLPVYGDGAQIRDWVHVDDHVAGVLAALERGEAGEVYNLGARCERTNRALVERIVELVGADAGLVTSVADRPAHDARYALDPGKAERDLAWSASRGFDAALAETVAWYRDNASWWQAVKDGSYRAYYRAWYEERSE